MATIRKRVSKSGELSFLIRVSLGYDNKNKQLVRSMTYKPDANMTEHQAVIEANRQAILFESKIKTGNLKATRIRFQLLADEWLDLVERTKEMKPTTLARLKSMKERTYSAIGKIYVDKLNYRQIQNFIISLANDGVNQRSGLGLSQKTQKHYISFISSVMKYAKKCGFILENPCKGVSVVRMDTKEKDVYSLEEVRQLLSAIADKAPLDYKIFFGLLASTGMRRGEALGIEYKDIDFDSGIINISRTSNYSVGEGVYTSTPKTKSSYRQVYVQESILNQIKELKREQDDIAVKIGDLWEENDRLFITWCGKPMHPNTPYTWLERFCKSQGLSFKGLHSFRHAVATQAITNGVDIKTVSAILGHSQTSTTLNIYTHAVQKANAKAFNLVADLLEGKKE